MIIAVLSDVHGNAEALCAVEADIARCGVDGVIFLGDLLFGGDEPQACFDIIRRMKPLAWLRGNTDDWLNEIGEGFVPKNDIERRCQADFLSQRPLMSDECARAVAVLLEQQRIEMRGYRLLCVHGSDRRINEPVGIMTPQEELRAMVARMDADILLCGHTHSPFAASMDGRVIINAGSVGKPQDAPGPCYCLLRLSDTFEYGFRKLRGYAE